MSNKSERQRARAETARQPTAAPTRMELTGLAIILTLAALLRMGFPGLTEFKADEARLLALALDMAEGHHFHLRGISSSVGLPNFPMSVWLYALPLVVWKQVYSATLFTGLLNTLAVLGCWGFVRRYWGRIAAPAAALMYAVSPWAVFFSRKIWAQNLLPFFVMVWAASAALAFIERRTRFILLHLVSLAIAVQIHLSAAALGAATILLMLVFRRRVSWRLALLGTGLAALTALPFAYDLFSAEPGLDAVLAVFRAGQGGTDLRSFSYASLLSLGRDLHSLTGPAAFQDFLATVPDISIVHWLWGGLILIGLSWLGWRAWRRRRDPAAEAGLLVVVWVLVPPLFFVRHSTPVFPHYLISTYPSQYIAAGVAFLVLAKRLRWAGWAILGASATAQVWVWAALLTFAGARATPGAFGTPLAMQRQAAELAETMRVEESAAEVLIAGPGESPEFDEFAAVNSVLLRSVPHRFVDIDQSAVFPTTPTVVLLSQSLSELTNHYLSAATRIERVPLRTGEGALHILALPGEAAPVPGFQLEPPNTLANGITLLGYDLSLHSEKVAATWQVHWRTGTPSAADFHFFNHLLDGSGQRVSQADAPTFSAGQWKPGDSVISLFALPWPADEVGPLTIRTGMYTYPGMENIPVLDWAGNPYSDAVEIALPWPRPEQ